MKNLILTLSALALLTSCAETRRMKEMQDTTNEMRDITKDMSKDTKDVKVSVQDTLAASKSMDGKMDKMTTGMDTTNKNMIGMRHETSRGMRLAIEAGSKEVRERSYAILKAGHLSFQDKTIAAATYLAAFDFQAWDYDAENPHALEERENLYNNAVQEFLRSVAGLDDGKQDIDPTDKENNNPLDNSEHRLSAINALAAAMHKIAPEQEHVIAANANKKKIEKVSMLDLIEKALEAGRNLRSGDASLDNLPAWIKTALFYEKTMIYLLQVRHNVLAGMAVTKLLETQDQSETIAAFSDWTADLDQQKINEAELAKVTEMLDFAVQTKTILVNLGLKPLHYKKMYVKEAIKDILKNMQVKRSANKDASAFFEDRLEHLVKEYVN